MTLVVSILAIALIGTYLTTWTVGALSAGALALHDIPPDRALWDSVAQPGWPAPDAPGMRWITPTAGRDWAAQSTMLGIGQDSPAPDGSITNHIVLIDSQGPWLRTLERHLSYTVTATPSGSTWTNTVSGTRDTAFSIAHLPLFGVPIPREFAITPVWPGFAIVWAAHALLLGLLWITLRAVRPYLRRWRGLCQRCGYSLQGLLERICPECGTSFKA